MSFDQFVGTLAATDVEFEHLKPVQVAQAILESGRGSSDLFMLHKNPYGMKYRSEMAAFATSVSYTDHAGETDDYCHFADYTKAALGYWAFIDRWPYIGWRQASQSAEEYIRFIAYAGYVGGPHDGVPPERREADRQAKESYIRKLVSLLGEAEDRLEAAQGTTPTKAAPAPAPSRKKGVYIDVGHGPKPTGYDPGAGNVGSMFNEHALNGIAAKACAEVLTAAGVPHRIDDRNATNYAAGKAALGYDLLVSVHHNSHGVAAQGSLGLWHVTRGRAADKQLAKVIGDAMAAELGISVHPARGQVLDVLRGGHDAGVRAAVLAEVYFMHKQVPANPAPSVFEDWSKRGGRALGEAIVQWLRDNP